MVKGNPTKLELPGPISRSFFVIPGGVNVPGQYHLNTSIAKRNIAKNSLP
jgi:hypothetical protein